MKLIQQLDETDCGAACIAMIAIHYGLHRSITSIRQVSGTDTKGTNLAGMVQASKKLGFDAHALKGNADALTPDLPVPFIVHLARPSDRGTLMHFAVVKKITKNKVFLLDPDSSFGRHSMPKEEFLKIWTGYVIFLTPAKEFKREKGSGSLLFQFLPILKPHAKTLALACVASVILIVFGIVSSLYFRYVIDEILFSNAKLSLAAFSIGMLCIVILQAVMGAVRNTLLTNFAFKTDLQLIFSYFSHVLHLPLSFFDTRKTGEIISRFEDAGKIRNALSQAVISVIMDTAMILVVGPVLFAVNKTLFFIVLLTVPFSSVILYIFSKLYRKQYKKLMSENAEVHSYLVESINGSATVKALNAESLVFNEYEKRQMKMTWTGWKAAHLSIYQGMSTELVKQIGSTALFWVGSFLIIQGEFSIGTLISFNALASYFTGPLERLVNLQASLQEAFVAANRLGEILELELEQDEEKRFIEPAAIEGNIQFNDVAFRYGTRKYVYEKLSFTIEKGQWAAFVGPSGCGKTTLIKLILKFYVPESGSIHIDKYDIRDLDASSLRTLIGYVPQDIFLFSGTIAENIALHKPSASLEEIMEASQKTGAHEFINSLPDRYNTVLGERGATLSGGERQRLALTRALLGSPQVLILDEATSNLDTVSEKLVHQTIEKLRSERITTILIAHRLSTVVNCDKIFVLDKGLIAEAGTHEELVQADGLYKKLWDGVVV